MADAVILEQQDKLEALKRAIQQNRAKLEKGTIPGHFGIGEMPLDGIAKGWAEEDLRKDPALLEILLKQMSRVAPDANWSQSVGRDIPDPGSIVGKSSPWLRIGD